MSSTAASVTIVSGAAVSSSAAASGSASAAGQSFKVGIVNYVDHASLNQIVESVESRLDAIGKEKGVTFDYADYYANAQADQSNLNQIGADLVADGVDVIVAVATPTAATMLAAVEDTDIPVVYSAVTDPAAAGFDGEENITGTSDALNTDAIMNLIVAANPGIDTIGLLYDLSQDSSTQAIADAKAFCEKNGIKVVEKNGTTTAEVQMAAEALVAAGVKAVFTPTDNTIMTAELSIYESFIEAGVQHYTGADSFALNGALVGYGVDYVQLGEATADMVSQLLCDGKTPADLPYQTFDNGIVTINTETAAALAESLRTGYAYPAAALHRNWELTLLNQFHDILPGSALGEVYEVSQQQYGEILASDARITDDALHTVTALIKTDRPGVVVFNQLGFARDTVVRVACGAAGITDGGHPLPCHAENGVLTFVAKDLPAKGWRFYPFADAEPETPCAEVTENDGGYIIDTPLYHIVFNGCGEITALLDKFQVPTRFENGYRYTDQAVLETAEIALSAQVNKAIVSRLSQLEVLSLIHI